MRGFRRVGAIIKMRLTDFEVSLLGSLTEQLVGLLEADHPADPDDPFARWQAELSGDDALDRSDPAIRRLFPDAYPGDAAATAEFRRLTQAGQRSARVEAAGIMLAALAECDEGTRPVEVKVEELDAWLKTLSAIRLSLAARLGIETAADAEAYDELPATDPRSYLYRVYEWLGYLSECLLRLG